MLIRNIIPCDPYDLTLHQVEPLCSGGVHSHSGFFGLFSGFELPLQPEHRQLHCLPALV